MYFTIRHLNPNIHKLYIIQSSKKKQQRQPIPSSICDMCLLHRYIHRSLFSGRLWRNLLQEQKSWAFLRKTVGGSCFSGKWGPLQDEFPGKNQEKFPLPMRKGGARSSFRWGGLVVKVGILPTGSPTITLRSPQQKSRNPTAWIFGCPWHPQILMGPDLKPILASLLLWDSPPKKTGDFFSRFSLSTRSGNFGKWCEKEPTDWPSKCRQACRNVERQNPRFF